VEGTASEREIFEFGKRKKATEVVIFFSTLANMLATFPKSVLSAQIFIQILKVNI
jgi:hypothetical protein